MGEGGNPAGPLHGLRVIDFTTLLPGPLATLMLAESGAEVIKVERPGAGDEMRMYTPRLGYTSVNFALLNRGKRSVVVDLKDADQLARLRHLVDEADVLVEQFRPGVMDRLGLGYEKVHERNPRLVYCSITGYGQDGPRAGRAGHDLNYLADTGVLDLTRDSARGPVLPPVLIADIAGGSYPAVINILLALRARDISGIGPHLDVSMSHNLFPLQYWALGNAFADGDWPRPGGELLTGGSPRYRLYQTADGAWLAAAPLEQRFWDRFCELIELPDEFRDDSVEPAATAGKVAELIAARDVAHWERRFAGEDACVNVVRTLSEAVQDDHFAPRLRAFGQVASASQAIPALPVPLSPDLVARDGAVDVPQLGADDALVDERLPP